MCATEEQKLERLSVIYKTTLYGLISGLWEFFGESSFATAKVVGDKIVQSLEERGWSLPIEGDDSQTILSTLAQYMADELGIAQQIDVKVNENIVVLDCKKCAFRELDAKLEAQDIQPFSCIPMLISTTALSKKKGVRNQIIGHKWQPEQEICSVEFRLIS